MRTLLAALSVSFVVAGCAPATCADACEALASCDSRWFNDQRVRDLDCISSCEFWTNECLQSKGDFDFPGCLERSACRNGDQAPWDCMGCFLH